MIHLWSLKHKNALKLVLCISFMFILILTQTYTTSNNHTSENNTSKQTELPNISYTTNPSNSNPNDFTIRALGDTGYTPPSESIITDPEPSNILLWGDFDSITYTTDSNSEGATQREAYLQKCENDLTTEGWTYYESNAGNSYGNDAVTKYEGSNSFYLFTIAAGTGYSNLYKQFALEDSNNAWIEAAVYISGVARSDATYLEMNVTSAGTLYYIRWWLDTDTACPADTGSIDYIDVANVEDTWYHISANITEILETTFSLTSFDISGDSRPQIRFYVNDIGGSSDVELFIDNLTFRGSDSSLPFYTPNFYEDGDAYCYYDDDGVTFTDSTDEDWIESDQNLPLTGLDLDGTPADYYLSIKLDSAFEGTGTKAAVDYIYFAFRIGAAGNYRNIYFLKDSNADNETDGVGDDDLFFEIGTNTEHTIYLPDIFAAVGWDDDSVDRLESIHVQMDADNDADDILRFDEILFYEGISGDAPTISNIVESTIGTDPFVLQCSISDTFLESVEIQYWHSNDNGTLDAYTEVVGNNFTMVNTVGDTYYNDSLTLTLCGGEPYVRYLIIATDAFGNVNYALGYYLFDEGVQLSDLSIASNDRLGFADHTFTVNVDQITSGAGIEISEVQFRYTSESQVSQYEVWSNWNDMTLISGSNVSGIYEGSFEVNTTYFDEDDAYNLQVRAENTNGLSDTLSIEFVADSTPESGIVLGRLNQDSEIVKCGNYTDDVSFSATISFAESQYTYTKTISNTQWEDRLINLSLITSYSCDVSHLIELEIYQDGSQYKLKLRFDEKPDEDSTTKIHIWESEPQVSNPQVEIVGSDHIIYSLKVTTTREFDNCLIVDQVFPSDIVKQAWWSNYKISQYASWSTYTDADLTNELPSNVTVWPSSQDEYQAHIEIANIDLTPEITKIYIKGELGEETVGFRINMPSILLALLIPFAGYTFVKVGEYTGFDLTKKVKKIITIGAIGLGVSIGMIFQFVSIPFAILPLSTLIPGAPSFTLPTSLFVLVMPTILLLLFLLIARLVNMPFTKKQTLNLLLVDLTVEVILSIAYLQGFLSLSIAGLETAERMMIDIAFASIIAVSIIIATALILKARSGELSVG